MCWINHTKIHVPSIAATNAKAALPHSEEFGRNTSASSIPSWADEIVAPVDGETNLFMQSCCIISPAVLRPIPVHKIASSLGTLEIRNNFTVSGFPVKSAPGSVSITPIKSDTIDKITSATARMIVDIYFLITPPPISFILHILVYTNSWVKKYIHFLFRVNYTLFFFFLHMPVGYIGIDLNSSSV